MDTLQTNDNSVVIVDGKMYPARVVAKMLNDANTDGYQLGYHQAGINITKITRLVLRLSNLVTHILQIAAYAERHKVEGLLLDLAKKEAGDSSIVNLATELQQRLNNIGVEYTHQTGDNLMTHCHDMVIDTALVSHALMEISRGDGAETLTSPEIINIHGRLASWDMPDSWRKPRGITPERQWLAKRVQLWRRQKSGPYHKTGRAIYEEVARKPENERSAEEIFAFSKLGEYMDSRGWVADRSKMSDYLRKLVSEYKKSCEE